LETRFTFDKIIGSSIPLVRTVEIAQKFASLEANLLIQGERDRQRIICPGDS
jgi:transcriptional regulator with PAS, ATPase and Fis domain